MARITPFVRLIHRWPAVSLTKIINAESVFKSWHYHTCWDFDTYVRSIFVSQMQSKIFAEKLWIW